MRSILFLLILVMIGLNGKGQSVTTLPDSVLSQCCLEVTLLNGNVTTVDWVFIQYITRDGTGTKLFVEYAPNFGGIQWETQIRIQDDFDEVIERSKFIILPFTVGSTDYGIHRNWIANIEENTTTGGTWIYGRFGTPTKRKFSAVEDYETLKNLLLACHPRAIVVAENGLYTEGDTVRMGGFLIENTTITTEGYNWMMKDTLSSVEFGLDYLTPETLDTTVYWARRSGSVRQMVQLGRRYYYNSIRDTTGGLYSDFTHSWNTGDPFLQYQIFNPSAPNSGTAWFKVQKDNAFLIMSNETTNPYYTPGLSVSNNNINIGVSENGSGDPGNGVGMGAYGFGTTEYLFMITKGVDDNTATTGQFLQLIDETSGEVDFATIDLSAYLPIADTAAMLTNYPTKAEVAANPTTIAANYIAASNGTNLVARNLFDNNTYVGILNSKPWQFGSWTTAGRPTGVNNYWGYNSTTDWIEGYLTSAGTWISPLQSSLTGGKGTATRVPFFDANGRTADSGNLTFTDSDSRLNIGGTNSFVRLNSSVVKFENNNSTGDFSFYNNGSSIFYINSNNTFILRPPRFQFTQALSNFNANSVNLNMTFSGTQGTGTQTTVLGVAPTGNVTLSSSSFLYFFGVDATQINASGTGKKVAAFFKGGGVVVGDNLDPVEEFRVIGDGWFEDSLRLSQAALASSILQTDASGWVKPLTVAGSLNYSGGTLTGTGVSSSIRAGLPLGDVTIDANYNSLTINELDAFWITGGASTELYIDSTEFSVANPYIGFGNATTSFSMDESTGEVNIQGNTEVVIEGLVRAKQEGYNTITSTSSPQTLSNSYSDNLIDQGSTQASFTFNFPASPADGQILTLTWNNAISVLTLDGNGETIVGTAVTTAVAGSQRKFKFYSGIGWIKLY